MHRKKMGPNRTAGTVVIGGTCNGATAERQAGSEALQWVRKFMQLPMECES
jgi:hypothetical protein